MENIELSLEDQFVLRSSEINIDKMGEEDLREYCKLLVRNSLERDNMYKQILAKQWGIMPIETLG